jgi:hypothetical protein
MITKLKNSLATNPAQSYLPNGALSRAAFLRLAAGMGAALFGHQFAVAQTRDRGDAMQTRPIPSSGEALPVIGCGSRASGARGLLRGRPNFPVLVVHRVVPAKLATRKSDGFILSGKRSHWLAARAHDPACPRQ